MLFKDSAIKPLLNPSFKSQLKPIFLNSRITAIKFLKSCTAPFPSTLAVLRRYMNRLIIIIDIVAMNKLVSPDMAFVSAEKFSKIYISLQKVNNSL